MKGHLVESLAEIKRKRNLQYNITPNSRKRMIEIITGGFYEIKKYSRGTGCDS